MTNEEIKQNISVALFELSRFRARYDRGENSWHNQLLDEIETLLTLCVVPTASPSKAAADPKKGT